MHDVRAESGMTGVHICVLANYEGSRDIYTNAVYEDGVSEIIMQIKFLLCAWAEFLSGKTLHAPQLAWLLKLEVFSTETRSAVLCTASRLLYFSAAMVNTASGKPAKKRAFGAVRPVLPAEASQKAAKVSSGCMKCDLCTETSKDRGESQSTPVLIQHEPPRIIVNADRKWAKFWAAKTPNQQPVPCETKCERCYLVWQKAFHPMYDWSELVTAYHDSNNPLSKTIEFVMGQVETNALAPVPGPGIETIKGMEIEVSRTYHCASDRELKHKIGERGLPKTMTQGLPSVTVPSEQGGQERVWLFKHPDHDLREVKVKMAVMANMSSMSMTEGENMWDGHGEAFWQHTVQNSCVNFGFGSLLKKETKVPTFAQWKQEKVAGEPEDVEDEPETEVLARNQPRESRLAIKDGAEDEDDDDEQEGWTGDEPELLGAAAETTSLKRSGSGIRDFLCTPPSTNKKKPSVVSGKSQVRLSFSGAASVASGSASNAAAEPASEGNFV
eukprot:5894053-Amphidinium_carterae.3